MLSTANNDIWDLIERKMYVLRILRGTASCIVNGIICIRITVGALGSELGDYFLKKFNKPFFCVLLMSLEGRTRSSRSFFNIFAGSKSS